MNPHEQIFLAASVLSLAGILNWLAGDWSVRGRLLEIRTGQAWMAMRWVGLGSFATSFMVGSNDCLASSSVSIAGALALLLGSARRAVAGGKLAGDRPGVER